MFITSSFDCGGWLSSFPPKKDASMSAMAATHIFTAVVFSKVQYVYKQAQTIRCLSAAYNYDSNIM